MRTRRRLLWAVCFAPFWFSAPVAGQSEGTPSTPAENPSREDVWAETRDCFSGRWGHLPDQQGEALLETGEVISAPAPMGADCLLASALAPSGEIRLALFDGHGEELARGRAGPVSELSYCGSAEQTFLVVRALRGPAPIWWGAKSAETLPVATPAREGCALQQGGEVSVPADIGEAPRFSEEALIDALQEERLAQGWRWVGVEEINGSAPQSAAGRCVLLVPLPGTEIIVHGSGAHGGDGSVAYCPDVVDSISFRFQSGEGPARVLRFERPGAADAPQGVPSLLWTLATADGPLETEEVISMRSGEHWHRTVEGAGCTRWVVVGDGVAGTVSVWVDGRLHLQPFRTARQPAGALWICTREPAQMELRAYAGEGLVHVFRGTP